MFFLKQCLGKIKPKDIPASEDFHVENRASLLSSDAGIQDFRGLYNLAGLALVCLRVLVY